MLVEFRFHDNCWVCKFIIFCVFRFFIMYLSKALLAPSSIYV